ncbi:MAG: hypothetical protein AAFU33_13975 [Bacteroidota bacterium]
MHPFEGTIFFHFQGQVVQVAAAAQAGGADIEVTLGIFGQGGGHVVLPFIVVAVAPEQVAIGAVAQQAHVKAIGGVVQGRGHGEFAVGVMQDGYAVVILALVVVGLLPEQVAFGVVLSQQHVRAISRHEGVTRGVEISTAIGGRGRPVHGVGQAVLGHPFAVDQGLGCGVAQQ